MSKGNSGGFMDDFKFPSPPQWQPSETYKGNQLISSSKKVGGNITNTFFPTPEEEAVYNAAYGGLQSVLGSLGKTAPGLLADYEKVADDYVTSASDAFNKQFDLLTDKTREDYGKRFGTLQATPYIDKLEEMFTNVQTPALQEIVKQGNLLKNDLVNQNEAKKLNELQAYGYLLNNDQANFLNSLGAATSASQAGNNLAIAGYQGQIQQYLAELAAQNKFGGGGGFLSGLFGAF